MLDVSRLAEPIRIAAANGDNGTVWPLFFKSGLPGTSSSNRLISGRIVVLVNGPDTLKKDINLRGTGGTLVLVGDRTPATDALVDMAREYGVYEMPLALVDAATGL